jgi:hypothetical protein
LRARQLAQPSLEPVPIDRGMRIFWHHEADTRVGKIRGRSRRADIEVRHAETSPGASDSVEVIAAGQPVASRKNRAGGYSPPAYFDGSRTVRRFRPFFRRRLKTSRPQRVDMRVRKPCVRIRRLFRGRYVGFPMATEARLRPSPAQSERRAARRRHRPYRERRLRFPRTTLPSPSRSRAPGQSLAPVASS